MSSVDLVLAVWLVAAVAILGAAMAWAFLDARRDGMRHDKRPPRSH